MTKKWTDIKAKGSPSARARALAMTEQMLTEMPLRECREGEQRSSAARASQNGAESAPAEK